MCASHSACRTEVLFSTCRSQFRSKQASPFVSAFLIDQKACALWLLPGFLRLTALYNSTYLWYNLSHPSPSMLLKMVWQKACRSLSSSGGAPSTVFHLGGVDEGALSTFFSSSQRWFVRFFTSRCSWKVRGTFGLHHRTRFQVLHQVAIFTAS